MKNISDHPLLVQLNERQREAVAAPLSHLLVLAGAGSGKTRVLVHRIAWLLTHHQAEAHSILAVTFTNKSAAEMNHRISHLIGDNQQAMWIGTFHGLAHRLLRRHTDEANLPASFQILDSDDQLSLIKRIIKSLQLDEKRWIPRQAASYINGKKDEGLRPHLLPYSLSPAEKTWQQIYQCYQAACNRGGLVDFAELLLRAYELWQTHPELLIYYQKRFNHILVDEFQDTNTLQYRWIQCLAGTNNYVMAVGDDDQSIYGWRGAQIENVQRFLQDFSNASLMRLEQNYRSTPAILAAANALIARNSNRIGKNLWTDATGGELINLYSAINERDEARFVVTEIKKWRVGGQKLSDCAILYRSNAQSRLFEEHLMLAQLPYRIYGGQRFFERQEIKNTLAYLRLICNRHDDAALERIINTPARGLGSSALLAIKADAHENNFTLWQAIEHLLQKQELSGRSVTALQRFIELINALSEEIALLPLPDIIDCVVRDSGLQAMYLAEKEGKGEVRIENLAELVNAAREFSVQYSAQPVIETELLPAFLTHTALEAGEGKTHVEQEAVQMMTLHASKGLEFPQVFIVGMEEGLFPSSMSLADNKRLEEERRLAYVGITRAKQKLYLSHAMRRYLYGKETLPMPSRFTKELPVAYLKKSGINNLPISSKRVQKPMISNRYQSSRMGNEHISQFSTGERVAHNTFGYGVIIKIEGSGEHERLQVDFKQSGTKWLVSAFAKLKKLER